ncbi:hypothetical protein LTR50_005442 [Elasticomyces elasticus]|nr:hypothetical protein LTR50_005442 [Elasticomyces elasticus]
MSPSLSISVPTTTLSAPPKSYTLYTVVLTLPLRKHTVQKRYSDFAALHAALVSETSVAPPAPLPAKSWFSRTVNNPELTETRRRELEAYLRAILNAEDGRWRSSSAWRAFLDLPGASTGGGATVVTSTGSFAPAQDSDRGGITDPTQWLDMHRELKDRIQSARLQLNKREKASTAQAQHEASANAKASLIKAGAMIASLEEGLRRLGRGEEGWGGGAKLGDGEIRRRRDLLGSARKEVEGLEAVLKTMIIKSAGAGTNGVIGNATAAATVGDKEGLWKGTSAASNNTRAGRVLGGPLKETERTRERDNEGVVQLQKQIMQEQEEDVLEIGKSVSRMKEMGIMINEELVVQNQMLGMLDQDVERVQGKIDIGKKRIAKIR